VIGSLLALLFLNMLWGIYADPSKQVQFGAAFWIMRGCVFSCFAIGETIFAFRLLRMLKDDLASHSGQGGTQSAAVLSKLHTSLKSHMISLWLFSGTFSVCAIMIGTWPYLRTLSSYFMAIIVVFGPLPSIRFARTLQREKSSRVSAPPEERSSAVRQSRTYSMRSKTRTLSAAMTENSTPPNGQAAVVAGVAEHTVRSPSNAESLSLKASEMTLLPEPIPRQASDAPLIPERQGSESSQPSLAADVP